MIKNKYLSRPNLSLQITPYFILTPKHLLGFNYGFYACDVRFKKIENAFYEGAEHSMLKEMTYGYDDIYNFGVTYKYLHVFKNGFTISPTIRVGSIWVSKKNIL